MARAPKKCADFDCEVRVVGRTFCLEHTPKWQTSTHPGSTRASRITRAIVLRRDPVCQCQGCKACTPQGCSNASTEDDHIHNLAAGGSNHSSNRQGMCHQCHSVKTARESRIGKSFH